MDKDLECRLREAEDYRQLVELKSTYCDRCDRNGPGPVDAAWGADGVGGLFVEDGVWEAEALGVHAVGREAIRASFAARRRTAFISSHCVMNPIIHIDGDTASGQWNGIFYSRSATGAQTGFGTYHETYVRTVDGWRFRHLRLTLTGTGVAMPFSQDVATPPDPSSSR